MPTPKLIGRLTVEAVMDYNLRKQPVIREILDEMFRAHGML